MVLGIPVYPYTRGWGILEFWPKNGVSSSWGILEWYTPDQEGIPLWKTSIPLQNWVYPVRMSIPRLKMNISRPEWSE